MLRRILPQCRPGRTNRPAIHRWRTVSGIGRRRSRIDNRGSAGNRGVQVCAGDLYVEFCLAELRLCHLDILIGNAHLLFQRIKLRVVIDFPPFSAGHGVAGLCGRPLRRLERIRGRHLLVGRWWSSRGTAIFRTDPAGREQQAESSKPHEKSATGQAGSGRLDYVVWVVAAAAGDSICRHRTHDKFFAPIKGAPRGIAIHLNSADGLMPSACRLPKVNTQAPGAGFLRAPFPWSDGASFATCQNTDIPPGSYITSTIG